MTSPAETARRLVEEACERAVVTRRDRQVEHTRFDARAVDALDRFVRSGDPDRFTLVAAALEAATGDYIRAADPGAGDTPENLRLMDAAWASIVLHDRHVAPAAGCTARAPTALSCSRDSDRRSRPSPGPHDHLVPAPVEGTYRAHSPAR